MVLMSLINYAYFRYSTCSTLLLKEGDEFALSLISMVGFEKIDKSGESLTNIDKFTYSDWA